MMKVNYAHLSPIILLGEEVVEDLIKLDDDAVITVRKDLSNYTNEDADNYHNSDVNVAIAAVITDPRGRGLEFTCHILKIIQHSNCIIQIQTV